MSMTREEAIKTFEDILQLSPTLDETGCSVTEAMKVALSALRPVSREQVEKVWPGCVVCKNAKYVTGAVSAVAPHDAHHEIETDAEGDFDFCPVCGRPLTDEAVQMVMERLEALYEVAE